MSTSTTHTTGVATTHRVQKALRATAEGATEPSTAAAETTGPSARGRCAMDEKPTADEIARVTQHLVRRSCWEGGHGPSIRNATLADPIGIWFCECGEVTWKAVIRNG